MSGGCPGPAVTNDLDTLLTALYAQTDDHVAPPRTRRASDCG
jgi:hypothetical protein